jgi:hypothetical protein
MFKEMTKTKTLTIHVVIGAKAEEIGEVVTLEEEGEAMAMAIAAIVALKHTPMHVPTVAPS